MATLSEDDSSWKASGIIRRDFRNTHGEPEVPRTSKNKRKNTKRWCRGKEGQEHDYESFQKYSFLTLQKCTRCGKEEYRHAIWGKLL